MRAIDHLRKLTDRQALELMQQQAVIERLTLERDRERTMVAVLERLADGWKEAYEKLLAAQPNVGEEIRATMRVAYPTATEVPPEPTYELADDDGDWTDDLLPEDHVLGLGGIPDVPDVLRGMGGPVIQDDELVGEIYE